MGDIRSGFEIFQINLDVVERGYAFRGFDEVVDELDFSKYESVYVSDDDFGYNLADVFHVFNTDHPEGYEGRSLSVSDIVRMGDRYFYCDSFGWVDVTNYI